MRFLLLFFIGIPILEMIVLIKVGGMIGAIPTVGLVVLTATIGVWLLKREGLATLTRLQQKIARGELPGKELLEGVMLIIGGALLLTPGFVTDAIGFVCLIPWLRQPVAAWLLNHTQLFQ
ncbi:FxsA family protein, partial [Pseudomonadales bacterium]|nr:FxsA family protein [Pseudomonadales bacterium]